MGSKYKVAIGIIVVVVIVAGGYLMSSDEDIATKEDVRIGFVIPLTGFASIYGENTQKISDVVLSEWMKKNEYDGNVTFIYEDDKGDTKTAVSAARKLIDIDNVDALIVLLGNSIASIGPIANNEHIPLLGVGSVSLKVPEADDYLFTGLVSPQIRGRVSADYIIDRMGNPTIATLSNQENDIGIAWLFGFTERYKERGLEKQILIQETSAGFTTTDFRSQLVRIKDRDPDFIVTTTVFSDTPFLLKQARELGVDVTFFGTGDFENQALIENAGPLAEGIYFQSAAFDVGNLSGAGETASQTLKRALGIEMGGLEAAIWDSPSTILEAVHLGGYSSETILSTLKKVQMEGALGPIAFDENGSMKERGHSIKTVRNGEFVLIEILD